MHAVAVADDGHCLAWHICSSESFMPFDLGIVGERKHENYNRHFGEGNWKLEWIADVPSHEGLQKAFKLNKALAKEAEAEASAKAA